MESVVARLEERWEELSDLEAARCALFVAGRLDQTQSDEAIQLSAAAIAVVDRSGSRSDRSQAYFVHAKWLLSRGRDPVIGEELERSLQLCDDDRDCQVERLLLLASLDRSANQLDAARTRIESAQALVLAEHGADHPMMAQALRALSQVAFNQGRYDEELSLLERTLGMQERLLDGNDPELATTALLLGFGLADRGRFDEAVPLYQRSLDIRREVLGVDNTHTAHSMLALGSASTMRGDYLRAKQMIEHAVAVRGRLLPPLHASQAPGVMQQAHLLERMGDKVGAENAYRRVLEIARHNEDFFSQFTAWGGLAGIAADRGDLRSAKVLIEKSLGLMAERRYTSHSWEDGRYLLAEIERRMGETAASLALHEAVLAERLQSRPAGNAWAAKSKFAVAMLQVELGDATRLAAVQAALDEIAEDYGLLHPDLEELMTRSAQSLLDHSRIEEAAAMALRAVDVRLHVLSETTFGLSEAEALRYADDEVPALDLAFSLAGQYPERIPLAPVWDRLMTMHDLVLRRVASRVALSEASADPATRTAASRLQASSDRYVRLLLLKSDSGNRDAWRKQLALARSERDSAERALAGTMIAPQIDNVATLDTLRVQLNTDQRLVSFVVGKNDGVDHYSVLIVGRELEPRRIDLGSVAEIDALLGRWRVDLSSRATGAELARRVLQPVLAASGEAGQLLLVPTGALHLLPWAALPVEEGRFLVERGPVIRQLHYEAELANAAATVPATRQPTGTGKGLLALGGARFGKHSAVPSHSACASFTEHEFTALPGSVAEVVELRRNWPGWRPDEPVASHLGNAASERTFRKEAPGKRVLHLATHAFVVDPHACLSDTRLVVRGVGSLVAREPRDAVALAGLALSNANRRAQLPSDDDGILAAEEIAMLDLRGVELAVLSACDTALGTLTSTEGVLGLRRAFRLAGVRSLVTSLWKVGDDDARTWMRAFYRQHAASGLASGLAAWVATAEVLATRRTDGADLHPVHWAGFVATGN